MEEGHQKTSRTVPASYRISIHSTVACEEVNIQDKTYSERYVLYVYLTVSTYFEVVRVIRHGGLTASKDVLGHVYMYEHAS